MRGVMCVAGVAIAVLMGACARERAPAASDSPARPSEPSPGPGSTPQAPTPAEASAQVVSLFPHVRASIRERWVEFDGSVAVDVHDPKTPRVFLELMVCTPDSKEHESLVVTRALPSHVHAALLAVGAEPGEPGSFRVENGKLVAVPPRGAPVRVRVRWTSDLGEARDEAISSWVVNADSAARFAEDADGFVFAGSRIMARQGRQRYDADGMGTLVGLTSFGAETIAWGRTISPDSWVEEPSWIADVSRVPKFGTAVVVRVELAADGAK